MTADDGISGFQCTLCGSLHNEVPLAFHADAPVWWSSEMLEQPNCELGSDQCVIGDESFFIKGLIRVPIVERDSAFEWGVWVSLSRDNFVHTCEVWETSGREREEPMFGWLSSALPTYTEPTVNLRTRVHTQPVGHRPLVELEPTAPPLAIEQREGIAWDALVRRIELLIHPS